MYSISSKMFVFLSIASLPYKNTYSNHDSTLFSINIFKECDTAGIKCVYWHAKSLEFDKPHPSLPIHHQCRCVLLPVTPLSDLVEESRPMAKADFMKEAERLYKAKYPNKDFAALADSTKKKYYYEAMREYERRTGEPAYTQVSGGVSFKDYFENHMTAQQQKDWLGPQRYKLYKDFKLPLDRFIPPYPNKRLTIDALKTLDKISFDDKKLIEPRASKEAIAFVKENIAENVNINGLDTKSLNALTHSLASQMKKYHLEKFDNFTTVDDGILAVSRDNKSFIVGYKEWGMIVKNPKAAYRRYVVQPKKMHGIRDFAMDSPQDVVSHAINHEIGHMVFNRATLENKEEILKKLWAEHSQNISRRANVNDREFFAESFAIYEKGGILDESMKDFIQEIIK